jgi:hypothetical protein
MIDFLMGGVSAAVSKTAAAPIERVKLLIQNQDEMIKQGRLDRKYNGIVDCFKRTLADEGTFFPTPEQTNLILHHLFASILQHVLILYSRYRFPLER